MILLTKMFSKNLYPYLFHELRYHFHASNLIILLSYQNAASEPFEPSPFMPKEMDDDDYDVIAENQQGLVDNQSAFTNEKENTVVSARESNVAKIKVVVC
jgi:kinesin family member 2/24